MKSLLKIMFALAIGFASVACHQEDILPEQPITPEVSGDEVSISFGVTIPDEIEVKTRAVDPDGRGIQTLHIFCFNGEGLFITAEQAEYTGQQNALSGTFNANIPNNTRIMHFVANQNMSYFGDIEATFRGHTEDDLLSILEGSSGMMIYWARVEVPSSYVNGEQVKQWITTQTNTVEAGGKGKPIVMLRNQARVTVASSGATADSAGKLWGGTYFQVTGFTVCNSQAFGTVAPYHSTYGFPTYTSDDYTPEYGLQAGSVAKWVDVKNVTLPQNMDKLSDIVDVDTAIETFIFETENSGTDPVSVIIRGKNVVSGTADATDKYYRVTLTDADGRQVLVRRNHHYEINIVGNLDYGVATFAEALEAPATNNIWLSISDEVKSVQDANYKLSVDETRVVFDAAEVKTTPTTSITFSVDALGSSTINAADVSVTWVEENQDVSSTYNNRLNPTTDGSSAFNFNIAADAKSATGTITLALNELPDASEKNILRGTLLVKYGRLQRTIKVLTVKQQMFTPAWVSTEVYGNIATGRENIEIVFNIPDDCPEELFPMDVLISANDMDIRSAAGQVLPIVRLGEEGYGEQFDIDTDGDGVPESSDFGYKYVYTVNAPGVQRVYFENILHATDSDIEYVTLEAKHFERLTKVVTFSELRKYITINGLSSYSYVPSGSTAVAENILYKLIPQKRGAKVAFEVAVKDEGNGNAAVDLIAGDEFLLYSSNLDHDTSHANLELDFKAYDDTHWGSGGRIFGFTLLDPDASSAGMFNLYLKTNKAKSAEPVRLASNYVGSPSVKDATVNYSGQQFRSVVFELSNYRPFRFGAQIKGAGATSFAGNYIDDVNPSAGETASADTPAEEVDNIEFAYGPNEEVEIAFDLTSFKAHDNNSVDPFGEVFEVYIEADMLELATNATFDAATVGGQKKLEKLSDGRFVYRVDADRATEATFGTAQALTGEKVAGERRVLKFKTKDAVSAGDIIISSNEEQVVYHSKTFNVVNKPIAGDITYGDNASSQTAVPANQFVSFSLVKNGSRIGSVTVTSAGKYELRLRKEYQFNWEGDKVELYTSIGGVYYKAEFADVKTLFTAPTIQMIKQ